MSTPRNRRVAYDHRKFALGKSAVRGIGISTSFILAATRDMAPEDARAALWLHGYARLLDRTADSFATELQIDVTQIRDCLTHANVDAALRRQFTSAVRDLRAQWEARLDQPYSAQGNPFPHQTPFHHGLGKLARTQPLTETKAAVAFAERGGWAVTEGLERMGKTVCGANLFLRRLDTSAWCRVPSGDGMRMFLLSLGNAVGIHCNDSSTQVSALQARIGSVLGPGKVETLFLDQFHATLPTNPKRSYPARLELLMDWLDEVGVNIVGIATPQWRGQLDLLSENAHYRVGQIVGRIQAFRLRDTLTQAELATIARSREPSLSEDAAKILALHAKTSSGYCGTLMNTIGRYRLILADSDARPAGRSDAEWQLQAVALAVEAEAQLLRKGGGK